MVSLSMQSETLKELVLIVLICVVVAVTPNNSDSGTNNAEAVNPQTQALKDTETIGGDYDGLRLKRDHFPVDCASQKTIYDDYLRTIKDVQRGVGDLFYPSLIDMKRVRAFRTKKTHLLAVLDVGGTSFKMAVVKISPNPKLDGVERKTMHKMEIVRATKEEYVSTKEGKPMKAYKWHEWVAEIAAKYFRGYEDEIEFTALTFSYPIVQESLQKARVKSVCKSWAFQDIEGSMDDDIVEVLNASLKVENSKLRVSCILNDSIATYMAGVAADSLSAQISMIIGTGTNGAFEILMHGDLELMNTEWAKTELPPSLLTDADKRVVDALKKTPYQLLEVLIAGYKFVDIVRERLLILSADEERAKALDLDCIIGILGKKELDPFEDEVKDVAMAYKRRMGRILAPILLAIAETIGAREIVLTMNGSVCENLLDRLIIQGELDMLSKNLRLDHSFTRLYLADGSLVGAALTVLASSLPSSGE